MTNTPLQKITDLLGAFARKDQILNRQFKRLYNIAASCWQFAFAFGVD